MWTDQCMNIDAASIELDHQGVQLLGRSISLTGFVQTAIHKPSGNLVAVKKYNMDRKKEERSEEESSEAADFDELAKSVQHEVSTMRQLHHPNIVQCLGSFVAGFEILVLTPFMTWRSVRDVLDESFHEGLPELAVATILRDVLRALHYLHSQALIHRSVRASHILLDSSGRSYLSGFRYSCSLIEVGQGIQDRYDYPLYVAKNNLSWMSPEFLAQNLLGYNEKSDIYSLGVTACEMANGLVPFSEMPNTLMLLEKLRGSSPKLFDASTFKPDTLPPIDQHENREGEAGIVQFSSNQPGDSGVGTSIRSGTNLNTVQILEERKRQEKIYSERKLSNHFHHFVEECCLLDANQRPSANQLLQHPFIKQLKKAGSHFSLSTLLSKASHECPQLQVNEEFEDEQDLDVNWEFV